MLISKMLISKIRSKIRFEKLYLSQKCKAVFLTKDRHKTFRKNISQDNNERIIKIGKTIY